MSNPIQIIQAYSELPEELCNLCLEILEPEFDLLEQLVETERADTKYLSQNIVHKPYIELVRHAASLNAQHCIQSILRQSVVGDRGVYMPDCKHALNIIDYMLSRNRWPEWYDRLLLDVVSFPDFNLDTLEEFTIRQFSFNEEAAWYFYDKAVDRGKKTVRFTVSLLDIEDPENQKDAKRRKLH